MFCFLNRESLSNFQAVFASRFPVLDKSSISFRVLSFICPENFLWICPLQYFPIQSAVLLPNLSITFRAMICCSGASASNMVSNCWTSPLAIADCKRALKLSTDCNTSGSIRFTGSCKTYPNRDTSANDKKSELHQAKFRRHSRPASPKKPWCLQHVHHYDQAKIFMIYVDMSFSPNVMSIARYDQIT